MTTTVTIKHGGPKEHDVKIEVINADTLNVLNTVTIASGHEQTLYIYGKQGLLISEVPSES